jgi:hypothetical protein
MTSLAGSLHARVIYRTMVLWLLESFPALIRVFSFIEFSFPRSNRMESSSPGIAIMSDQNLVPCEAASAGGQPPAELQLPSTRRSRKSHDLSGLSGLRRDPASCEERGCGSMNRDVVVGSDLACADLGLELHTALLN